MIVTDVGGLREIVPDKKCGYVVRPDPTEIANAISDYFEKDRKRFFLENIREEKKKYSWNRMTDTIIKLHSKIFNNDNKK